MTAAFNPRNVVAALTVAGVAGGWLAGVQWPALALWADTFVVSSALWLFGGAIQVPGIRSRKTDGDTPVPIPRMTVVAYRELRVLLVSAFAAVVGGAVISLVAGYASVGIIGLTVENGKAAEGGGIYNDASALLAVRGSTFSGNTASVIGGGLCDVGKASLQECSLSGNTAGVSDSRDWHMRTVESANRPVFAAQLRRAYSTLAPAGRSTVALLELYVAGLLLVKVIVALRV